MSEVVLDGARREEELRGDLLVREPFGHEACDLQLLRCELVDGAGFALPWDPEAMPAGWEAGRRRYFTLNWIQLAATWTVFALFLAALILL